MPPEAAISIPSVTNTVPKMSDQSNGNKSLWATLSCDWTDGDLAERVISLTVLSSSVKVAASRRLDCWEKTKKLSLALIRLITKIYKLSQWTLVE